jgi:anti-sigma B factor antagonist
MPVANLITSIRNAAQGVCVIDLEGEVTGFAEDKLMDAYTQACTNGTRAVILNFSQLDYMNSSGIGLLVTLLIRAQRQKTRLLATGLNQHYQQIFEITRLNEAIGIYATEAQAVATAAH